MTELELKQLKQYLDAQSRGEKLPEEPYEYKNNEPGLGTIDQGVAYVSDIDSRFNDAMEASSDFVRPNILGLPKHTDDEKAAIRAQNAQLAEANTPLGFTLIDGKGAPTAAKAVSEAAEIAPTAFQKIRKLVEGAPKGVVQSADSAALARARAGMTKPGTISEAKVLRAPSKTPVSGANLPGELETGAEAMVKTPEEKEIVLKALKKRFGY